MLTFANAKRDSVQFIDGDRFRVLSLEGAGGVNVDVQTYQIPYLDGSVHVDSNLEPRPISLEFGIFGQSKEDVYALRNQLNRLFNPKLGAGLIHYDTGLNIRETEAFIESGPTYPGGSGNETDRFQRGIINFICPDPYWRSLHQTTRALKAYEPKFILPVTFPASMGEVGDFTTVLNEGDVDAPVLITVSGPVVNPEITNETTGETLRINVTLSQGEVLYIDTDPRRKRVEIYRGGQLYRKAFGLIDRNYAKSTLWKLAPGENNLSYVADEGNENATVVVQWNDRFVAV